MTRFQTDVNDAVKSSTTLEQYYDKLRHAAKMEGIRKGPSSPKLLCAFEKTLFDTHKNSWCVKNS